MWNHESDQAMQKDPIRNPEKRERRFDRRQTMDLYLFMNFETYG
jgi:hypothetical protein